MIEPYSWAANKAKLQRVLDTNPKGSEEDHKEAYVKLGGLVVEGYTPPEVSEAPVVKKPKRTRKNDK